MPLHLFLALSVLFIPVISVVFTPPQIPLSSAFDKAAPEGPSPKKARANAPEIFNAIHSSARQWGSSLNHNGMSIFPARIPNNTHLYHGTSKPDAVKGMEWLAFEIEHAEMFAQERRRGPPRDGPPRDGPGEPRKPGGGDDGLDEVESFNDDSDGETPQSHGYLHVYRTTRPLRNLLYLDGMSAGKCALGSIDTQDFLLRNSSGGSDRTGNSDYSRGEDLCALGAEWGVEGFIRMEMGFEVIFCDFSNGLVLESARQRPAARNLTANLLSQFEVFRGASLRYNGITGQRLTLDYSGTVSAFWYNLNLTNPDATRADLPRLPASDTEGLARMKDDLKRAFKASSASEDLSNDWQGVTDMIVTRYSDRLQLIAASETSRLHLLTIINMLTQLYMNAADPDISTAIQTCEAHYLIAAIPQTLADRMIHEALSTVTQRICTTLFNVRQLLQEEKVDQVSEHSALEESKVSLKALIEYLNWTTWRECGRCSYDEFCAVAIWPWGTPEDHYHPSCMTNEVFSKRRGYWGDF